MPSTAHSAHPEQKPIFIHGMWRTGGTYIWSKLREQSQYLAYYEPLHETFLQDAGKELQAVWSPHVTQTMRHPHLDTFYFAEYAPFLEAAGSCLLKGFPYQRYCLEEGDADEPLRDYVADLVLFARAKGKTPVLKFDRALLRSGWLTAHFQPINILLVRRPIDVWKSFLSFENRYFHTVVCLIAGQNQFHPWLQNILRRFDVPFYESDTVQAELDNYHEFAVQNLEKLYPLFYELYLLASIYAARYADCVIDMNEISENMAAREEVTAMLRSLGINISLVDCAVPSYTDLTPQDQENLASEENSLSYLQQNLSFRIPKSTFEKQQRVLSGYFQKAFSAFVAEEEPSRPVAAEVSPKEASREKHRKAIRLFERGQIEEASALLKSALLHRQTGELWNDWASAQAALDRPALAELGFRRALEFHDKRAAANLGALLIQAEKYGEAIPLFEQGLQSARGKEISTLTALLSLCRSKQALAEAFAIAKGKANRFSTMPGLGLSMIVRNGEATLDQCLRSVQGLVDEIVIGDTGSTDASMELAQRHGTRVIAVPWENDFSRARNRVLEEARTEWILSLDADEMLDADAPGILPKLLEKQGMAGYIVPIWNYVPTLANRVWDKPAKPNPHRLEAARSYPAYVEHQNVRLFRRDPEIYFEGRVHETVGNRILKTGLKLGNASFVIHHFGLATDAATRESKNKLYRELGREKVRETPNDSQTHFELGIEELDNFQNPQAALAHFERALELNPKFQFAWTFYGVALLRLERYKEALQKLKRAEQLGAQNTLLFESKGDACYHLGDFESARRCYRRAYDPGGQPAIIESKLGVSEVRLGRKESGISHLQLAIEREPEVAELYDLLVTSAVWLGDLQLAAQAAERRLAAVEPTPEGFLRAASIRAQTGEWQRVTELLREGCRRFPEAEKLRLTLAEFAQQGLQPAHASSASP